MSGGNDAGWTPAFAGQTIRVDPDEVAATGVAFLSGHAAGPAGLIGVELVGGLSIAVDFAEPERLVFLEMTPDAFVGADDDALDLGVDGRSAVRRTVEVLLGAEAVRMISDAIAGDGPARATTIGVGDPGSRILDLGPAMVGLAVGGNTLEHRLVRAVAVVEAGARIVEAVVAEEAMVSAEFFENVIRAATEVILDDEQTDMWLARLSDEDRRGLLDAATAVRDGVRAGRDVGVEDVGVDGGGVDSGGVDDRVDRGAGADWAGALVDAVSLAIAAVDHADLRRELDEALEEILSDEDSLVLFDWSVDPDHPYFGPGIVSLDDEDEHLVNVVYLDRPDGSWLRIFDRASLSLLALVPIVRKQPLWVAKAILPDGAGIDTIAIEPTQAPLQLSPERAEELERLSPETSIDRTIAAFRSGRIAAAASMRGDAERSRELWEDCAARWRAIGDGRRAELAEGYAAQLHRVTRSEMLHDRVRDLIGDDAPDDGRGDERGDDS